MSGRDADRRVLAGAAPLSEEAAESSGAALLVELISGPAAAATVLGASDLAAPDAHAGGRAALVVGELVGFAGSQPLVLHQGQRGAAAIEALSLVDLHAAHVGRRVALAFENGDPQRPIVIGWLRGERSSPELDAPGAVEVDADGERMLVSAKRELVLRCGQASITLTRAGKVLIQGKYVSSRSAGVNRIKGGSVQIN